MIQRKLAIPYTTDTKILELIKSDLTSEEIGSIKEIFMPLSSTILPSGRLMNQQDVEAHANKMESDIMVAKELGLDIALIASKPILDIASATNTMVLVVKELERLKQYDNVTKVIISNYALLNLYGEHINNLGYHIELSVICEIDSIKKVQHIMSVFPFIKSICLSNNFANEKADINYIKAIYPNLELKILVNHSCLVNCASHVFHHDIVSTVLDNSTDITSWSKMQNFSKLNNSIKICDKYIESNRDTFNYLKETAVIRPEDIHLYDDVLDVYKISGRGNPSSSVIRYIKAYANEKWDLNLIDITEIPFEPLYIINNSKMPLDYGTKKLNCRHRCYACTYCEEVLDIAKEQYPTGNNE